MADLTSGDAQAKELHREARPLTESFAARFERCRSSFGQVVLGLDPSDSILGQWSLGQGPDALERFVDIALRAARGSVGVIKPQSAFYERHGWRGIKALARLVSEARSEGILVLLDAKRGDVGSTNDAYGLAYLEADAPLAVDALTLHSYLGFSALEGLVGRATRNHRGVFVVARSTNPEGRALQESLGPDGKSVEIRLVEEISAMNALLSTDEVGPIGAVFGPAGPPWEGPDLRSMRGLFLAPGLGAQGALPDDLARCFASCPERVMASASRSLLTEGPDVSNLKRAIETLSEQVSRALSRP